MTSPRSTTCASLAVMLLAATAGAPAAGEGEHREHGAHEHGHGTLQVAVDGDELVIELRVPAANVVGFEHEPGDDAERERVRTALATFARTADLFMPSPAARCKAESGHVEMEGMDVAPSGEGHAHGDAREKEPAAEHGHGGEGHAELEARYRFHCEAPGELDRVEVKLFQHLRDVEELDAQVVAPGLQTQVELTPGSTSVPLTR